MRLFNPLGLLAVCGLLIAPGLWAATNLLPGLTYYPGRGHFAGKLVFLVHSEERKTDAETAASIYELEFAQHKLRKVTDAPNGVFIASPSGDVFCTVYCVGAWREGGDTNVFVYSESSRSGRVVKLDSSPRDTIAVNGYVFFQLQGYGENKSPGFYSTKDKRQSVETRIVCYDIAKDETRLIELPGASTWRYQDYERIHAPRGQNNVLHFFYKAFGQRLVDGRDYREGVYSFDVRTGEVQWIAEILDDKDDERYYCQASDGRYVFFEGDSAPIAGYKLVSSPHDAASKRIYDPKGKDVKLLKKFPKVAVGAYLLAQMSPDRRYVLVRLQTPANPSLGYVNTYFLVNSSTGETALLLKDTVARDSGRSMSVVRWIE